MKHTRTVEVPATTKEVVHTVICDLCNNEIEPSGDFIIRHIDVEKTTGTSYSDWYEADKCSYDLCLTCFDSKLMPWLESQGARPTVVKYED